MEAQGSLSVAGVLDPRLAVTATAAAAFGLGDHEQDSWRFGGGIRFAPDRFGRGPGLDLDTRLMSGAEGRPAGLGVRGEAGYGLWTGPLLGVVRPYVGLIHHPGDGAVRRTAGLDVRDTAASRFKVEIRDRYRDLPPALEATLYRRF